MRWRGIAPAEMVHAASRANSWDSEVLPSGRFVIRTARTADGVTPAWPPLTEKWLIPGSFGDYDELRMGYIENPPLGVYGDPSAATAFPPVVAHALVNPWVQTYRGLELDLNIGCGGGNCCSTGTATLVAFLPTLGGFATPQTFHLTPSCGCEKGDDPPLIITPRPRANWPATLGALLPAAAAPWLTALGPRLLFRWRGSQCPVTASFIFHE